MKENYFFLFLFVLVLLETLNGHDCRWVRRVDPIFLSTELGYLSLRTRLMHPSLAVRLACGNFLFKGYVLLLK